MDRVFKKIIIAFKLFFIFEAWIYKSFVCEFVDLLKEFKKFILLNITYAILAISQIFSFGVAIKAVIDYVSLPEYGAWEKILDIGGGTVYPMYYMSILYVVCPLLIAAFILLMIVYFKVWSKKRRVLFLIFFILSAIGLIIFLFLVWFFDSYVAYYSTRPAEYDASILNPLGKVVEQYFPQQGSFFNFCVYVAGVSYIASIIALIICLVIGWTFSTRFEWQVLTVFIINSLGIIPVLLMVIEYPVTIIPVLVVAFIIGFIYCLIFGVGNEGGPEPKKMDDDLNSKRELETTQPKKEEPKVDESLQRKIAEKEKTLETWKRKANGESVGGLLKSAEECARDIPKLEEEIVSLKKKL